MRVSRPTKIVIGIVTACLVLAASVGYVVVTGNRYTKYTDTFFDTFDTAITVVGYTKSEKEFDAYFKQVHSRFLELHQLYDIYNTYKGLNNVKTINDNAGIAPVKVDKDLLNLILFSKDWYTRTGGQTNIALGSVLKIWHQYREQGMDDPDTARLPPMEDLREAAKHTDINKVQVDTQNSTVYLADKSMSLDLGAVAKGYATEIVAKEIAAQGFKSGIISSGGNIRTIGKPLDGIRARWGIGIQDPQKSIVSDEENLLDVVFINDASVVSSGDYQRYYVVDGRVIHHLIDPKTLMPADYYHAVTVVTPDSGVADFMSTSLFLLPYNESRALAEKAGVDAIWVLQDGRVEVTDGIKTIAKSFGATGAKP